MNRRIFTLITVFGNAVCSSVSRKKEFCKTIRQATFLRNLFRANQNSNHLYSVVEILGGKK